MPLKRPWVVVSLLLALVQTGLLVNSDYELSNTNDEGSYIGRGAYQWNGYFSEGRGLLLLRLANELEDHLDAQVLYCRGEKHGEGRWASRLAHGAAAADALGEPALARAFTQAKATIESLSVPASLVGERRFSFVQPPLSHVPRKGSGWRYRLSSHPGIGRGHRAVGTFVRRLLGRFAP